MTRTQAVTPLRQRMLDDMRLRNMADGTRRSYVRSVADFSAFRCAVEPSSMVVRARMVQKPIAFQAIGVFIFSRVCSSSAIFSTARIESFRACSIAERMSSSCSC